MRSCSRPSRLSHAAPVASTWQTRSALLRIIATGFLLLPWLGIQASAAILAGASALAIVSLYLCSRSADVVSAYPDASIVALLATGAAVAACVILPAISLSAAHLEVLVTQALLVQREGLTEVVTVTEVPTAGCC